MRSFGLEGHCGKGVIPALVGDVVAKLRDQHVNALQRQGMDGACTGERSRRLVLADVLHVGMLENDMHSCLAQDAARQCTC